MVEKNKEKTEEVTTPTAVTTVVEATGKKKSTWTFDSVTHHATVTFPDGKSARFDLKKVFQGAPTTQLCLLYYGFKQWVASNYAAEITIEDRIASAKADYQGLIEHGLEFAGDGGIGIIGRVRSNAGTGAVKVQLAKANSMLDLMMKKLEGKITPEEEVILIGMMEAKKELEKGKN